ncbi:cupin domain-containing protein [Caballeronia novacaledonica]|uniref:cupin domain-containing protein n=1 Tax=Caballeronia novacaledonica TaxID=1544861 RepID=UPI001EE2686D|nr:cupin domain-containing protein [Caballeronia novacaledonica]GJH08461.1 cupin domain-containing protein [Caballeronia novacaledonica]
MTNTIIRGQLFDYSRYRGHFAAVSQGAVAWSWPDIAAELSSTQHGERGTFTLSTDGAPAGCEILPGMAVNVQVVQAGASTRPHAHAWWHLFVVQSGSGTAYLGADRDPVRLAARDLLLVPAWCEHGFHCDPNDTLILFSASNLPQQTGLGNQIASEPVGEPSDTGHHS